MGLKENIKMFRQRANMTQEEVGNALGVKKQTIQKYESGEISNIPYDNLVALAKILNITEPELFGYDKPIEKFSKENAVNLAAIGNDKELREIADIMVQLSPEKRKDLHTYASFLLSQSI